VPTLACAAYNIAQREEQPQSSVAGIPFLGGALALSPQNDVPLHMQATTHEGLSMRFSECSLSKFRDVRRGNGAQYAAGTPHSWSAKTIACASAGYELGALYGAGRIVVVLIYRRGAM
jgi:hypothetical protein